MFGKSKINLGMINPSSKIALKISCLQACGNDVDEAEKLYKFVAEDIASLPDFDVQPPTTMQRATQSVNSMFGWVKENREDLLQAWDFIQGMRGNASRVAAAMPPVDVPPIPSPQ